MPPRRRRLSVASEDTGQIKETESFDNDRQSKSGLKNQDVNTSERRLTARQQSKQDAAGQVEPATSDRQRQINNLVQSGESSGAARQPTRCSTRVVKRPKRDLSPPESPVKKGRKTQSAVVNSTPETKGKRPWELWSVEDKDSFFEGLCEYGKDFESIQNLIVAKCKKKGSVMPITAKNKEQVRHFYYRTWHKIAKLIQPVKDLKKDITELYGLISYSVLRKKLRGGVNPNDKNWQKLNELVHHGVSTIKVKGKKIRVKMPACSALKRLYNIEENKKEPRPKVPEKIRVEFRPKSNVAWRYVQDLSQNPRLRIVVKPERSFQSLVKFLSQKWKPQRLKNKEMLNEPENSRQEFRVYPDRSSVVRCINMQALDEGVPHFSLDKLSKDSLTTSPSNFKRKKDKEQCSSAKTVVNTNVSSDASKAVISNNCVILDCKENKTEGCAEACEDCTSPRHEKNGEGENVPNRVSDGCGTESVSIDTPATCSVSLFKRISETEKFNGVDSGSNSNTKQEASLDPERHKAEKQELESVPAPEQVYRDPEISAIMDGEDAVFPDLIPLKETTSNVSDQSIAVEGTDNLLSPVKSENESPGKQNSNSPLVAAVDERTEEIVETILHSGHSILNSSLVEKQEKCRKLLEEGWKVDDRDQTTLAELYLMFGLNGELKLEYEWVNVKSEAEILQEKLLSNMDNMLRRLSHIAMVEFTDFTKAPGVGSACQLCGQVQGLKQKGRGKDKPSPGGRGRMKKTGKDVAVQTLPVEVPKEVCLARVPNPSVPVSTCVDGVFRVPVLMPHAQHKTTTTTLSQKDLMSKGSHGTKPLMRPRKLKPVNRGRTGSASIVQRTILPKNQLVTFFPVLASGQSAPQNGAGKEIVSQTIVGHPIKGIQTPGKVLSSPPQSVSPQQVSTLTPEKQANATGVVEMSLSPEGDQTLMRIPASHIGTMSPESLKAAGLSTVSVPLCISTNSPITTTVSSSSSSSSSTVVRNLTKGSLSPPNLSSLLDISFQGTSNEPSKFMDLVTDTSFSGILDETSKSGIAIDPGLTTPPIRSGPDRPHTPPMHSPPVRSLFRSSPAPESQWLNGDVQELSLSSLFESPSKSSSSYPNTTIFNNSLPPSLFNESSRDSQSHKLDVDTTLHCMMNESSIDYVKKFQDLAEQIFEGEKGASIKSSI